MRPSAWQILFGVALIGLSAAIYVLQIYIFDAPRDTFFYLFQDLAFVPISVLMVTVIIDQVLRIREKRALLKKMNMVIGAFFSDTGGELLRLLSAFDSNYEDTRMMLVITMEWTADDFDGAVKSLESHEYKIESKSGDLAGLKDFLIGKRSFLLSLLENANLLEHETFTDLLWAVFHVAEELSQRKDTTRLPDSDMNHLSGDIKRAYVLLISEWLSYMKHLKGDYPYLFSLAVRTNPFNPGVSVEVR